jgi:hypothetical protein
MEAKIPYVVDIDLKANRICDKTGFKKKPYEVTTDFIGHALDKVILIATS